MTYELTEAHLSAMFEVANLEVSAGELIFFGLRGSTPLAPERGFAESHRLIEQGVNFLHMRCTLGQWLPGQGFAVYPGSTVPHLSGVEKRVAQEGRGVNMLAPCYLTDLPGSSDHRYGKGDHGITSPLGPHRAFRNAAKLPVWRTADDADYEGDDRLVYQTAFDNLHCARQLDLSAPRFSSLGCQVVAGLPGGPTAAPGGEKGPWQAFVEAAYALPQGRFRYALFAEREALRTVELGAAARTPSVRFGSTGELARHLQQGLIAAGHDIDAAGADGIIGFQTLLALRDVQLRAFGAAGVDLVAGSMTAAELGITWPSPAAPATLHPVVTPPTAAGAGFSVVARREQTGGGRFRWVFDDPVDGKRRYLGGEASLQGFTGLARTKGFDAEAAPLYDHAEWAEVHGPWAALIEPTGEGESRNSFTCLNSYDRAAFTFGFYQLAAHTPNDNLILLFRRLLATEEAAHYLPDLTLHQGRVHLRGPGGLVALEGAQDRPDGENRPGEQGAFMHYLNADMHTVDPAERRAASRLVHWACHSAVHRALQVEVAIDLARKKVARIASRVTGHGASLDGRPMAQVSMALDILHNGRGGSSTFSRIAAALKAPDPMHALKQIGRTPAFADRIDRVAARAAELFASPPLAALRYDAASNGLVAEGAHAPAPTG